MCGIAGILGESRPRDGILVETMVASLSHRGPDGVGVALEAGAALGHARLAILDLSPRGAQPMVGADGRHVIAYNGEIYNFRELRAELAATETFTSDSDTEVLLAAWRRWGEGCLDRLNGMFAFCLWDRHERTAFFARDRFGQKPLFLAELGGRLAFASEIKALLAAGCRAAPNNDAWLRYLAYASYDDGDDTFFAGIRQLPPGACATWSARDGLAVRRWYRLAERIAPLAVDRAEAVERIRELMVDVGRIHMRSDVPVGVSLSGGFDSSALLACFDCSGTLHEGVACYLAEFGGPRTYTERPWVEAAVAHHRLPLTTISYTPEDMLRDFASQILHAEAPLGGLMNCARDAVMAAARANGTKVVQDGTGLDEAFAGYRLHHALWLGTLLRNGDRAAEMALAEFCANWGVGADTARVEAAAALSATSAQAIDGTTLVRADLLRDQARQQARGVVVPRLETGTGDALRDSMLDYICLRKIPRNTRFTDRMSMAHGVELRFPFLDHRLMELGLSLPSALYFLHGRSKSIVRESMAGLMDDAVRVATKRSVHTPQGAWLASAPVADFVGDLIASDSFASRGFFDVEAVKREFAVFRQGNVPNSFYVWQWINLEQWFRTFIDEPGVLSEGLQA